MKKEKSLLNKDSLNSEIIFLKNMERDFVLSLSNYTATIECDIEAFNKSYVHKEMDNVVFMAYTKVLNDLLDWSANEQPDTDRDDVEYYNVSKYVKDGYYPEVYNIDLKSAYATILHKEYFIQTETFEFINSLKKPHRLACLGMLAARQTKYIFQKGVLVYARPKSRSTESYFYYCAKETQKYMDYWALFLGKNFIFSWVDGIYFLGQNNIEYIMQDVNNFGLKSSVQKLTEFRIKKDKKKINISFYDEKAQEKIKNGEVAEKKIFNIPLPASDFKKHILKNLELL